MDETAKAAFLAAMQMSPQFAQHAQLAITEADPAKQAPMPVYNSNPMGPEAIAYGDERAKQFNDKMNSVMYEPTMGDYIGSAMGEGKTHQQIVDDAMNLAGSTMGTVAKVPGAAGQGVQAIKAASQALPARGVGQGVGLIDTAQKGLGKVMVKGYADGGMVGPIEDMTRLPGVDSPMVQLPQEPSLLQQLQASGAIPQQTPTGANMFPVDPNQYAVPDMPSMGGDMSAGPAVQQQQAPQQPGVMGAMQNSIAQQKQANTAIGRAEAQSGQEQQQAYQQQAQQSQQFMQDFTRKNDELSKERTAFVKDLQESHVDPSRYMHDMNAGAKISTAIGLLIGGLSTAAENPAVKFLEQQMQRDIDAQKANLGKKENLLSANLRHFGNLKDATAMTQIMHNDYIKSLTNQAAAKAASPIALANAQKMNAQLDQQSAMLQAQLAMSGGGASGAQNDQTIQQQLAIRRAMGDHKGAEEMEGRYVPGMGMAAIKVPEKQREALIGMDKLDKGIADLQSFIKTNPLTIPGSQNSAKAAIKARALQTQVREALLNTVYREGEQPLLDEFISASPTGITQILATPAKLQELSRLNQSAKSSLTSQYSIPNRGAVQQTQIKSFKPSR